MKINDLCKTLQSALYYAFEEGTEYDYLISAIEIINREFEKLINRANEIFSDVKS